MEIIAIDPGENHSAVVIWDGKKIIVASDLTNDNMLSWLDSYPDGTSPLVLEWLTGYGIPAGASTFDTCRWVGRFQQEYRGESYLLPRRKIKQHLQAANDKFVRQALIARFGEPGTKKAPGLLYGITGHKLAAFACAVCFWDLHEEAKNDERR